MNEIINAMSGAVARYLLVGSVSAAVLVALALLLLQAGRIRRPVYRHMIWLYTLVGFIAVPALWLHAPKLSLRVLPAQTPSIATAPAAAEPRTHDGTSLEYTLIVPPSLPGDIIPVERPHALSWTTAVAGAWAVGFTLMLVRLGIGWRCLRGICLSAAPAPSDSPWPKSLPRCRASVRLTREIHGPVCCGILRPTILLPYDMYQNGAAETLRIVLAHELAHIDRRDCWANLFQRFVEAVYFFHPLVLLASRQLTQEREHVCDNHVLAAGVSPEQYTTLLAHFGERAVHGRSLQAVALVEGQLLSRVRSLLDPRRNRQTRLARRIALVCGIIASGVVLSFGTIRLAAKPAEPATANDSATAYRVLRFPEDRSIGQVSIGDLNPVDGMWWQAFKDVAEARGAVKVPADKSVVLRVSAEGIEYLPKLAASEPNDIQVIEFITPARVDDAALARVAEFRGLRVLDLSRTSVTPAGLKSLVKLNRLERLNLGPSQAGAEGLKWVGHVYSLKALDFYACPITDEDLACFRGLDSLALLWLNGTSLTGSGFRHLNGLQSLREIHLANSGVTDDGLAALAQIRSLERLSLDNTKVSDQGAAHLQQSKTLRELTLQGTAVTDAGLAHVARITTLERLRLPRDVTAKGLGQLAGLKQLTDLDVSQIQYDGGGLEPLRQWPKLEKLWAPMALTDKDLLTIGSLSSLRVLAINNSPITNEGLAHLAGLKSLRELTLHNGSPSVHMLVTTSGLAALRQLPLTYLWLYKLNVDDSRLAALAEFPMIEELQLPQMPIRDEDLVVIGKLSRLKRLRFETDTVSDGGLAALGQLTSLEWFVPWVPLTDEGLRQISRLGSVQQLQVKGAFTGEGLRPLASMKSLGQLTVTTTSRIDPGAAEQLKKDLPGLYLTVREVPPTQPPLEVHGMAPAFTLTTFDGAKHTLAEYRGKVVVMDFWATWCKPCTASMPAIKQAYAELKERLGDRLIMIGLSIDDEEALARRYVERERVPWHQACLGGHSELAARYGVVGVPTYVVIGPDGTIASASHDWADTKTAVINLTGTGNR